MKQRIHREIPKRETPKKVEEIPPLYDEMQVGDYVYCSNTDEVSKTLNLIAILKGDPFIFVKDGFIVYKKIAVKHI